MKKLVKLFVLIIISLSTYFIYKDNYEDKIRYVNIGDGLAEGINSYNEKICGYDCYIKNKLESENKLRSYNSFVNKDLMVDSLIDKIKLNITNDKNNNIKRELREADLVTVSIGINDFIFDLGSNRNSQKIISTKIVDKIDLLTKEIKKYYKGDIVYVGFYNFYPQKSVERNILEEFNKSFQQFCEKNDCIYIKNNFDNINYCLDNPNSMYPNSSGYRQISNNILKNT